MSAADTAGRLVVSTLSRPGTIAMDESSTLVIIVDIVTVTGGTAPTPSKIFTNCSTPSLVATQAAKRPREAD